MKQFSSLIDHLKGKWEQLFSLSLTHSSAPSSPTAATHEWLKRSIHSLMYGVQCNDEWHLRVDINWKYFHELNWELINIIFTVWTTSWPESMCGQWLKWRCERKNIVGRARVEVENCKLNFYANFKLCCVFPPLGFFLCAELRTFFLNFLGPYIFVLRFSRSVELLFLPNSKSKLSLFLRKCKCKFHFTQLSRF